MDDDDLLRRYVANELGRISSEKDWPSIVQALTQQLTSVVAAWPNVTVFGLPYRDGGKELAEKHLA
jgi:hypothetical protein